MSQTGFGGANESGIIQNGSGNVVLVQQTTDSPSAQGTLNRSQIAVDGAANTASVTQNGAGAAGANASTLNIVGSGNMVNVVQSTGP